MERRGKVKPDPSLTLLTTREYCELRRITPESARTERFRGLGPKFIRTGSTDRGRVLYRLSDVSAWLASRTVEPGSA
jgi:hypothetical protein